jgi:hypothetical protein
MRLTREEMLLVVAILAALLIGAGVKHYREQGRVAAAADAIKSGSDEEAPREE